MGFFRVLWKNNIQNAYLTRIRIPGQIVFEVIARYAHMKPYKSF